MTGVDALADKFIAPGHHWRIRESPEGDPATQAHLVADDVGARGPSVCGWDVREDWRWDTDPTSYLRAARLRKCGKCFRFNTNSVFHNPDQARREQFLDRFRKALLDAERVAAGRPFRVDVVVARQLRPGPDDDGYPPTIHPKTVLTYYINDPTEEQST